MKSVYFNAATNKPVNYGDMITFKEDLMLMGKRFDAETTLPIVNETIPYLIKKGIIIMKEIEEEDISTILTKLSRIEKETEKLHLQIAEWNKKKIDLYNKMKKYVQSK